MLGERTLRVVLGAPNRSARALGLFFGECGSKRCKGQKMTFTASKNEQLVLVALEISGTGNSIDGLYTAKKRHSASRCVSPVDFEPVNHGLAVSTHPSFASDRAQVVAISSSAWRWRNSQKG